MRKTKNINQVSNNNIESHNDSSFLLSLTVRLGYLMFPNLAFILPSNIISKGADYGNNHR